MGFTPATGTEIRMGCVYEAFGLVPLPGANIGLNSTLGVNRQPPQAAGVTAIAAGAETELSVDMGGLDTISEYCAFPSPSSTPSPTPTPISSQCASSTYDVILLLDQSASISIAEYSLMSAATVDLVSKLSSYLSGGATGFQFGVVAFSSAASVLQTLTSNQALINSAVSNRVSFGSTRIDLGLQQSYSTSIGTNTRNANKKIILYTDGNPNSGTEAATVLTANTINNSVYNSVYRTEILCVGIGDGVDYSNLYNYAANPSLVYSAATFNQIQSINAQIVNGICQPLLTPNPTSTTTLTPTPTTTITLTPTTTLTPTSTTSSTGDICVSGAGSEVVNGTYTYSGTKTIGGITRPQYIKDVNYNVSIVSEGGNTVWSISNTDLLFTYYLGSTVPPPQYPYQETSWISSDQGINPVPTVSSGNCSVPTSTPTPTPSVTPLFTIYTHGLVRETCSDYCTTNYNITTLTSASNTYLDLSVGNFIYGISGAGFIAYSNVSTDTTTGPFRIAEIDSNGEVLSIQVCVANSCEIL